MFTFDITQFVPDFILSDSNGYALAIAEQAALSQLLSDMLTGVSMLEDPAQMPEWRLDEAAWELGCLYDYQAETEQKRRWIAAALGSRQHAGTPGGLRQMIEGYMQDVLVQEWFDYGGDPYHFRLAVSGRITAETRGWISRAVSAAGNLRSVMDGIMAASLAAVLVSGETEMLAVYELPMTAADHYYEPEEEEDEP